MIFDYFIINHQFVEKCYSKLLHLHINCVRIKDITGKFISFSNVHQLKYIFLYKTQFWRKL